MASFRVSSVFVFFIVMSIICLIESFLSLFFQVLFNTPSYHFPFLDWILLLIECLWEVVSGGFRLISIFILSLFNQAPEPLEYVIWDFILKSFSIFAVFFYPILIFIPSALSILIFGAGIIMDTFMIGGAPIVDNPPAGNVMHILYNITDLEDIVANLMTALIIIWQAGWLFGVEPKDRHNYLKGFLKYAWSDRLTRKKIWRVYRTGEMERKPIPADPYSEVYPNTRGGLIFGPD